MACEILSGDRGAAFFCNTTDWCFGPLMRDGTEAERFRKFLLPRDPRSYSNPELEALWHEFRTASADKPPTLSLREFAELALRRMAPSCAHAPNSPDEHCLACQAREALTADS